MIDSDYTVLVVDDSSVNRNYLHYVLDEDGYRVAEAPSGEACLSAVPVEKPLLILLDVVMTGIDGFETLRRLKLEPASAGIPVIMLTTSKQERDVVESYQLGVNAYISKPVQINEFIDAINKLKEFWLKLIILPPKN